MKMGGNWKVIISMPTAH